MLKLFLGGIGWNERNVSWTGRQDFSGLTGYGFNHDNPEKSCLSC
jgi:hypothetical protein